MVCEHCGNLLEDGALVCSQCGAQVNRPHRGEGVSARRQGRPDQADAQRRSNHYKPMLPRSPQRPGQCQRLRLEQLNQPQRKQEEKQRANHSRQTAICRQKWCRKMPNHRSHAAKKQRQDKDHKGPCEHLLLAECKAHPLTSSRPHGIYSVHDHLPGTAAGTAGAALRMAANAHLGHTVSGFQNNPLFLFHLHHLHRVHNLYYSISYSTIPVFYFFYFFTITDNFFA
jgi:hypothetical protein